LLPTAIAGPLCPDGSVGLSQPRSSALHIARSTSVSEGSPCKPTHPCQPQNATGKRSRRCSRSALKNRSRRCSGLGTGTRCSLRSTSGRMVTSQPTPTPSWLKFAPAQCPVTERGPKNKSTPFRVGSTPANPDEERGSYEPTLTPPGATRRERREAGEAHRAAPSGAEVGRGFLAPAAA